MTIADPAAGRSPLTDRRGVGRRAGRGLGGWLAGPVGAVLLGAVVLAVTAGVMIGWFDSLSVIHGFALWVPVAVAVACVLGSIAGRGARWWRTWGAGLITATTAVVAVAHWWVRYSGLVLDHYPARFVVFVWLAVAAVGVAVTGWWAGPAALRALRVLAAPVSLLASFLLINSYYGYWPTVATLLGKPVAGQMSKEAFAHLLGPPVLPGRAAAGRLVAIGHGVGPAVPISRVISPPAVATTRPRLPPVIEGRYGPVDIPGRAVGFAAAQAYLWIPPDFASVPHAGLPVIVMLPGWPGNVQDWARAGRVTDLANSWARTHGGQAPVILLVDENGASGRDTECVDSMVGRAESYLTGSVPAFLEQTLGISPDPRRWALVGYSEGGTCALTLALRHPGIYGRFVDIAGDPAPNYWGGPAATLRVLYGGSTTAAEMHTPGWLLRHHRYPGMVGWFATGSYDGLRASNAQLAALASEAGIQARTLDIAGGHTWTLAGEAFTSVYPALVGTLSGASGVAAPAS